MTVAASSQMHETAPSGAGTFGFLALMSLAQGTFARRCVPETENRSLEEIEALFDTPQKRERFVAQLADVRGEPW
jgi:hypothetical protein